MGQYLERPNVERAIFRNLKISNTKITKDELFDFFHFRVPFFIFLNYWNTQSIFIEWYIFGIFIAFQTVKFEVFFRN